MGPEMEAIIKVELVSQVGGSYFKCPCPGQALALVTTWSELMLHKIFYWDILHIHTSHKLFHLSKHLHHTSYSQGYHFKIFLNIFSPCSSSCTWKFQVVAYNFSCTCALGRCAISLPNVTNPVFVFVVRFCLFFPCPIFSFCASHLIVHPDLSYSNVEKNVHTRHHWHCVFF